MGKTMKKNKTLFDDGKFKFDVLVRVHGRGAHTETYSIRQSDLSRARNLGYFNEDDENEVYYDWKPLETKNFHGGIKDVDYYSFDEKYAYAHTVDDQVYSLPKYLFDRIGEKKEIMVGLREK